MPEIDEMLAICIRFRRMIIEAAKGHQGSELKLGSIADGTPPLTRAKACGATSHGAHCKSLSSLLQAHLPVLHRFALVQPWTHNKTLC